MLPKLLCSALIFVFFGNPSPENRTYQKEYYPSGKMKAEGWLENGQMADWWLFYDDHGRIDHKCQLKWDKKNGYCLKYRNERLTSAEKYRDGKKIDEWYSFSSFRRDNNLSDLR